MIELRWILPKRTTTDPKRLQYREVNDCGEPMSSWRDVPLALVPDDEFFYPLHTSEPQSTAADIGRVG